MHSFLSTFGCACDMYLKLLPRFHNKLWFIAWNCELKSARKTCDEYVYLPSKIIHTHNIKINKYFLKSVLHPHILQIILVIGILND